MTESSTVPGVPSSSADHLIVQVALRTDVGRVRSENQDFGILSSPEEEKSASGEQLMMVADGMGGHRGGATASRLAATTVKSEFFARDTDDIAGALKHAFQQANQKIFDQSQTNPDLQGMGTTGSALVIRNNHAIFAHVGDSRIYLVRDNQIQQLTEDHSLVASMVREGLLTSKEAETHPRRNVLQRSIGVMQELDVDVSQPLAIQPGDVFILCSDGLHGLVKEEEMLEVARLPIGQAADLFVAKALERGAPDNVTVIVGRVIRESDLAAERTRDTAPMPAPVERKAGGGASPARAPLLKWIFVVVLILAAAGALAFWRVQYDAVLPAVHSSR